MNDLFNQSTYKMKAVDRRLLRDKKEKATMKFFGLAVRFMFGAFFFAWLFSQLLGK